MSPDELIAIRHLAADIGAVWAAFTTPAHLAAFWGGDHATVPPETVTVDLRVGGSFELDTGGGRRLSFRYELIDEPRRLVLAEPRTGIVTDIRLDPHDGGTTITVHQRRLPPELRTEQARAGLSGILDHLQALVENR